MRRPASALLLALLAAQPGPAAAQPPAGLGPRAATEAETGPALRAVGRVEIAGRGYCSGALVAPALVLTAAHCLHARDGTEPHPPGALRFHAGYRHGAVAATRRVRRVVLHPDYVPGGPDAPGRVASDIALMVLSRAIDPQVAPPFAAAGPLARGDRVAVISYAEARDEYPSVEDACAVVDRGPRVLAVDCDVTFGASGAPVLSAGPDGLRIASVISSGAVVDGRRVAFAATVGNGLERLLREVRRPPRAAPVAKMTRPGRGDRDGMRFIRP